LHMKKCGRRAGWMLEEGQKWPMKRTTFKGVSFFGEMKRMK
jgi:hypothetical protein